MPNLWQEGVFAGNQQILLAWNKLLYRMQPLRAKNTSSKRTCKYIQMLFLGWNVGLASDVFLLESGCVGFLASSFMCHSFYTANIINKLHPHSA